MHDDRMVSQLSLKIKWYNAMAISSRIQSKRGTLLKDVQPGEFHVACDFCQDKGLSMVDDDAIMSAYMKYATSDQREELAALIPHRRILLPVANIDADRKIIVFSLTWLLTIMEFLTGKNAPKYIGIIHGHAGEYKTWE